jgi:hypothetical protein
MSRRVGKEKMSETKKSHPWDAHTWKWQGPLEYDDREEIMSGPTSGKWEVKKGRAYGDSYLYMIYSGLRKIAQVSALPDEAETAANAYLMAASPAFLQAIEAFLDADALSRLHRQDPKAYPEDMVGSQYAHALDLAQKAMGMLEGEQVQGHETDD